MSRAGSLSGKVVVITGGSAGIGAALAESVVKRGARVVLAARREKELNEVAARLSGAAGGEAVAVPVVTDVTRRAEVDRLMARALARCGQVDVWVNNAGRGISKPVADLTDDDLDTMMLVNVKSALYGMQAALPHFKQRGTGQIINVSSMLGRVPYVSMRSAYSASKHFLNSLSANLRMDLAGEHPGIHVTTVMPGVVSTDFGLNALGGGPDSRSLPMAQPVEEVGEVIAAAIEKPVAEVYTRPGYRDMVVRYYTAEL
jgi:NADP-dependent 3-hydroxy acid dehydrogenase YdfG